MRPMRRCAAPAASSFGLGAAAASSAESMSSERLSESGKSRVGREQVEDLARFDREAVGPVIGLQRVVQAQEAGPGGL